MNTLDYLKLAQTHSTRKKETFSKSIRINIITNFTDDIIQKILIGMIIEQDIDPCIYTVPYKQYHFELKNQFSSLYKIPADFSFFFFDINPYAANEFVSDEDHGTQLFADIRRFCESTTGTVILNTFPTPVHSVYGNSWHLDPLMQLVRRYNVTLRQLQKEIPNLYLIDSDRFMLRAKTHNVRDTRNLYAFDIPFSHDFLTELCHEWVGFINAHLGLAKKCLVVDLDNTLWGGVVGEVGPLGIELGEYYPGNIYLQVQRTILGLYERGIILAINSRNNIEDVREVFEKNSNMILKENHFSSLAINWNNKADNLKAIADELNIGMQSLVFLDDDAMNRDLVRSRFPMVTVPEMDAPEKYVDTILSLRDFPLLQLTEEDRQRGKMYTDERRRNSVRVETTSLEDYISQLQIHLEIHCNDAAQIARLSQLTQKTNQFNLTTRRYSEHDLTTHIQNGSRLFSCDVSDQFGKYGVTLAALFYADGDGMRLDTFLMSCRVMGRGVEQAFLYHILHALREEGIYRVYAEFIPTAKNIPAANFLPTMGFTESSVELPSDARLYEISLHDPSLHTEPMLSTFIQTIIL